MPITMNVTNPEEREAVVGNLTVAGRFVEAVLPLLKQRNEELRSVIATVEAAAAVGGSAILAANAQDQEDFEAAMRRVSPHLQRIVDFSTVGVEDIRGDLDTLARHPVVRDVLPVLIVEDEEDEL